MDTTAADITTVLAGLSSTAAGWYNGISSGGPVIVPSAASVAAANAAATQVALQQQQQALLSQTNPALAGLLANPSVIVIIGLAALVLVIWLTTKK